MLMDIVIHSAAIVDWGSKSEKEAYSVNVYGRRISCFPDGLPLSLELGYRPKYNEKEAMEKTITSFKRPEKPVN